MTAKRAADLKKGDAVMYEGARLDIVYVRRHRRYQGYMAVQYQDGDFVREKHIHANTELELVNDCAAIHERR